MNINKISILISVALSIACVNVNAQQYRFVAVDNTLDTKICVSAGSNNLKELKKLIRISREGLRSIANDIICNNLVMAHFAHKYGADNTFKFINRRTKFKDRIRINTVTIQDIARVNNVNEEVITIHVGTN